MGEVKKRDHKKTAIFAAIFLLINILALVLIVQQEKVSIAKSLISHTSETNAQFGEIMDNYEQSFQLFAQMMAREIENNPSPDGIWDYLKGIDAPMLEIEGETFDGLYMYYKGRYLYSWDTPYSEYEETGYDATERPWYQNAVEGNGKIVFTPPYKSYTNPYMLTTISQLQPDGETVFAYDIKMGDIQRLVEDFHYYDEGRVIIYGKDKTIIGSTEEEQLGESLDVYLKEGQADVLEEHEEQVVSLNLDGREYYGCVCQDEDFWFLVLVPRPAMLKDTLEVWLIPILIVELLLIYILGTISRGLKNRELKRAYIELGQTQRRLEIALNVAQKAAAIDDLTGMMNVKSFRQEMMAMLRNMDDGDSGIFIMIDGDHFKKVNDNYGHNIGDEVIKLAAQMIVGRIRTVDLASRLHGDEFAIFVADSGNFSVAKKIIKDINQSIAKESPKRNLPAITLSAGAVIARKGDNYATLYKTADEALYRAKQTHDGSFAC